MNIKRRNKIFLNRYLNKTKLLKRKWFTITYTDPEWSLLKPFINKWFSYINNVSTNIITQSFDIDVTEAYPKEI